MPSSKDPSATVNAGSGHALLGLNPGLSALLLGHISDPVGAHPASAISYNGGNPWADGTPNPPSDVAVQLDKVIDDLAPTTLGSSGVRKLGVETVTVSSVILPASTLFDRVAALQDSTYVSYDPGGGGANWLDGTPNPATHVNAQIKKIITDLVSIAGPNSGIDRIGGGVISDGFSTVGPGSVSNHLVSLMDADHLTFDGTVAWGGRTNPQASVDDQLAKIIGDLIATGAGDDGSLRVGAQASGGLFSVPSNVRTQLDLLKDQGYMTGSGNIQVPLGMPLLNASDRWYFNTGLGIWVQGHTSIDGGELWFPVPITIRGVIDFIFLSLDGDAGPGGVGHVNLPAVMPTFTLYQSSLGVLTLIDTASDLSPNVPAYESSHAIVLSAFPPLVVDPDTTLYVKITGETGPIPPGVDDELAVFNVQYHII